MQSVQNLFSTANNKVETTQNKKKNHGHHSYDNEILFDRNLITLSIAFGSVISSPGALFCSDEAILIVSNFTQCPVNIYYQGSIVI